MNLKEMQSLPHKWWKKDTTYMPCTKDLPIDMGSFQVHVILNNQQIENIHALKELTLHSNVQPALYDWLYAINTELLEFNDTRSPIERYKEMADIAIFCALCLKYQFHYDISNINYKIADDVTVQPVYSYHALPNDIIQLLTWASSSPFIPYKIKFNKERIDHGHFRR